MTFGQARSVRSSNHRVLENYTQRDAGRNPLRANTIRRLHLSENRCGSTHNSFGYALDHLEARRVGHLGDALVLTADDELIEDR